MSSPPVSKDDSLTAVCSVCGSPAAAHLHYGAVSCYSCRAFFRRGQPKQIRCRFGHGECRIDRQNRTNCKMCRYNKCLQVGMKPDKVDFYLNKRKERGEELISDGKTDYSPSYYQAPNRSPASEEHFRARNDEACSESVKNVTDPALKDNARSQVDVKTPIKVENAREMTKYRAEYEKAINQHLPGYYPDYIQPYPSWLTDWGQLCRPRAVPGQGIFGTAGGSFVQTAPYSGEVGVPGYNQRNREWRRMNDRGIASSYSPLNESLNTWKLRQPSTDRQTNQTSVIRYENENVTLKRITDDTDYIFQRTHEKHTTNRKINSHEKYNHLKQELYSPDNKYHKIENNLSRIQFASRRTENMDKVEVEESTFPSYDSVIKKNLNISLTKPNTDNLNNILHTVAFPIQEAAKSHSTNVNEKCRELNANEIKDDKSDDITSSIIEKKNKSEKIHISKRKPNSTSDTEEEEIPLVAPKVSSLPLKKRQKMLEIPYPTGHALNKKFIPLMAFTFEEEFQVVDYIVRIEHYQNRRFEFVCDNFAQYREVTTAYVACKHAGRKIPFNRQLERMLFAIGLEFTKQRCKEIYKEMGQLKSSVRREVLNSTYPALYVVMWAILEGNTRERTWMDQHMKTLHITKENHAAIKEKICGLENVRSISLEDQERFTSPWTVDLADELKFYRTVSVLGRLLRDDLQLQALYHMFVMMSPSHLVKDKIQMEPALEEVQTKLGQLIYRYLSTKTDLNYTKSGNDLNKSECIHNKSYSYSSSIMAMSDDVDVDELNPDEKARLLISLVEDLHDCVDIMQNRCLLAKT